VHDFNARNRTPGGPKGFEAEHGTREPFHGSMVLLDDIMQILGVADHDSRLVRLIVVEPEKRRKSSVGGGYSSKRVG
jgi:hypothetical protein